MAKTETRPIRIECKQYEAVKKMAKAEHRDLVQQLAVIVEAGLEALKRK